MLIIQNLTLDMLINMGHMQNICAKFNSKLFVKYYSAVMHKR